MRGVTGGASAALLSSFATEKNPALLAGVFAKSVAASFGAGRAGGDGAGGRKRPTVRLNAARRGGAGGPAVGGESHVEGARRHGRTAPDADAVKAAIDSARRAASDLALSHIHTVRHGVTRDVRDMYCLFGVNKYIFFYFHFLCLIWHVIERYG